MDETEKTGQMLSVHKVDEEEMAFSMTTQLENLIVTPDSTNTSSKPQTHPEETGDTASTATVPPFDSVCKAEDIDDDDSEDSDRYFHKYKELMFLDQTRWLPVFLNKYLSLHLMSVRS